MSSRDIVIYLVLSAGLLAMPIGAFGLFDALNGERRGSRRVSWLIATYGVGVVLSAFSLVLEGHWYLGAPVVLMMLPMDTALRKHGKIGSRQRA